MLKGYTRSRPHHGVSKEALLSVFQCGLEKKYHISLNMASNGSFVSITVEQSEQLVENLAQIYQCYSGKYDRTLREPKGEDPRHKELSDKLDKNILANKRQVHFVGKFDGNQEVVVEACQDGREG